MAEIIDTLNNLIATCRDSERGFGEAAKGVHSDDLRTRFTTIAMRRAEYSDELAEQVQNLGGKLSTSGPQSAGQEPEVPKDDATFLAEIQTREDNVLRHYEQALTLDLPIVVRPVIERHRLAVQEALMELRGLEQVRKAG